jgi:hypothetical protein
MPSLPTPVRPVFQLTKMVLIVVADGMRFSCSACALAALWPSNISSYNIYYPADMPRVAIEVHLPLGPAASVIV